jgi:hypothetical protein
MTRPTTRPGLLARLRTPQPVEIVEVDVTGSPKAVTAIVRALASVAVVTGMRHSPTTGPRIRVQVTCHPTHRIKDGAP